MSSEIIQGWEAIAKFFPYTLNTVRQKHGPIMRKSGYVFKSYIGSGKHNIVWTFKEFIFSYLSTLQSKTGRV